MKPELSRKTFLISGSGCVAALLAGCSGGGISAMPSPTSTPSISPAITDATASTGANIAVTSATSGSVPLGLAGLAFEKYQIAANTFTADNSALIGVFQRLGKSVMRLGGNTTDETTYVPSGVGSTVGQVAPSDILGLAAFLQASGWQVIYSINLASNTPANAAAEASAAAIALGRSLYAFEIGNECDLYPGTLRPPSYDVSQFQAEWLSYALSIQQAVPGAPLIGPSSSMNIESWTAPFVSAEGSRLLQVTQHYYSGTHGTGDTLSEALLIPDQTLASDLQQLQSLSSAVSGGFRLAECNTANGGGSVGVSNSYVSALWVVDFLLASARGGCAGVNIQEGFKNPAYAPIMLEGGVPADVSPIFYGMTMVSQIAPGPMYAVNVSSSLNVSAYAIGGEDGATYLVIINKSTSNAANALITLPKSATNISALILSGTGLTATSGTTLGGAMIGNNGSWTPTYQVSHVSGASFGYNVAPISAALLKIT